MIDANIKVIAFDADDTLWVNEPYFQAAEKQFCDLMEDYMPHHSISRELLQIEIANMPIYGYGIKAFMLSMVETALKISDNRIPQEFLGKIIDLGKELLDHPIELIAGIEEVLEIYHGRYRLVMATKGDLLDQERKLKKSGLAKYFHHTEIVSEKHEDEYRRIVSHLDIQTNEFLMIGNSLKSDIIPVLNIGGHAFHVPYHTTWAFEQVDATVENERFRKLSSVKDMLTFIS